MYKELNLLLGNGLMTLRASHPELLKMYQQMTRHWDFTRTLDNIISTYQYPIPHISSSSVTTKRIATSVVARIFDVQGWFAPTALTTKIIIQKACMLHFPWHKLLPE